MLHLYCRKVYSHSGPMQINVPWQNNPATSTTVPSPVNRLATGLHRLFFSTTLALRLEFLPNRLVSVRSGSQVRAPAPAHLTGGRSPRHGDNTPAPTCSRRIFMKAVLPVILVFA